MTFLYLLERKSVMLFLSRAYATCSGRFIVRVGKYETFNVFAKLIWGFVFEPMRHDKIIRSVKPRGQGLTHPFIP